LGDKQWNYSLNDVSMEFGLLCVDEYLPEKEDYIFQDLGVAFVE